MSYGSREYGEAIEQWPQQMMRGEEYTPTDGWQELPSEDIYSPGGFELQQSQNDYQSHMMPNDLLGSPNSPMEMWGNISNGQPSQNMVS